MKKIFCKILFRLFQTFELSRKNDISIKKSQFIASDRVITKFIFRQILFEKTLNLKGGVLEVGVGAGNGLRFFIRLQEFYQDTRKLYAFDSFQGFPKGSKYDSQNFNLQNKPTYKLFSQTFVREFLSASGASADQINGVRFIQGFIPESLEKFDYTPIAFLNLDLDLYQPTIDSLNYFWKYVLPGGVVLLDDYDDERAQVKWPGVKQAVDEFCKKNDITVMRGYGNHAYLIKIKTA